LVGERISHATNEVMKKSMADSHYARDVALKLAKTNLASQQSK